MICRAETVSEFLIAGVNTLPPCIIASTVLQFMGFGYVDSLLLSMPLFVIPYIVIVFGPSEKVAAITVKGMEFVSQAMFYVLMVIGLLTLIFFMNVRNGTWTLTMEEPDPRAEYLKERISQ